MTSYCLPQSLIDLKESCESTMLSPTPQDSIGNYVDNLRTLTTLHARSINTDIQKTLIDCWVPYMKYLAFSSRAPGVYTTHFDHFVQYATQNDLVTSIVANSERAEILAGVVMMRVVLSDGYCSHPDYNNVGDLLHQWSGQPVDESIIESLQATTDFLYGPAVWPLYRNDVEWEGLLPSHLWLLEVPLKGSLYKGSSVAQNNDMGALPSDML